MFTCDPAFIDAFWLVHDYMPEAIEFDRARFEPIERTCAHMGGNVEVIPVPVPHDCVDGFFCAFWRRPEAYLDPAVRAGSSQFPAQPEATARAVAQLTRDLESGAWYERHAALLELDEIDLGYRLLIARSE